MINNNGKRIILRKLDLSDAPFILELLNSPGWLTHIGDKGIDNLNEARSYLVEGPMKYYAEGRGLGLKGVCLTDSNKCIGLCGLLQRDYLNIPDLGYAILPEYYGNGFTYNACRQVLQDAKEKLELKKIAAITSLDNQASIALLYKLNFTIKDVIDLNGESINHFELNL